MNSTLCLTLTVILPRTPLYFGCSNSACFHNSFKNKALIHGIKGLVNSHALSEALNLHRLPSRQETILVLRFSRLPLKAFPPV